MNWYVYCNNNPIKFVDPLGLWEIGDEKLSQGALRYISYYEDLWEMGNAMYQRAVNIYERYLAQAIMNNNHNKANDIRKLDKKGLVQEVSLDVPSYNQFNTDVGRPNHLCWATCISMWMSYLVEDKVDRTLDVAKTEAGLFGRYNQPEPWHSTDEVANSLGITGVTSKQEQGSYILSMSEIQNTINSGSPFAVLYSGNNSGHWVLGIGYVTAPGHETLVVANDPARNYQTAVPYRRFITYFDGRRWTSTAK